MQKKRLPPTWPGGNLTLGRRKKEGGHHLSQKTQQRRKKEIMSVEARETVKGQKRKKGTPKKISLGLVAKVGNQWNGMEKRTGHLQNGRVRKKQRAQPVPSRKRGETRGCNRGERTKKIDGERLLKSWATKKMDRFPHATLLKHRYRRSVGAQEKTKKGR